MVGTIRVRYQPKDKKRKSYLDQTKVMDMDIKLKEFLHHLSLDDCPYYWKDEDRIPKAWNGFLETLLPDELKFCGPFDLSKLLSYSRTYVQKLFSLTNCLIIDKRFKDNPKVSSSNLMSYVGGHGSWTPCHFDHCGSIGHNLMTWADEGNIFEFVSFLLTVMVTTHLRSKHFTGSSSVWYIASPRDFDKVKRRWRSWGQFFEQENYFATIPQMRASKIMFYKVDQKPGDLVILPPMAPHQVYNEVKKVFNINWLF